MKINNFSLVLLLLIALSTVLLISKSQSQPSEKQLQENYSEAKKASVNLKLSTLQTKAIPMLVHNLVRTARETWTK